MQKVIVKLEFGIFEKVKINKKVKCYSFITSKLQTVQQKEESEPIAKYYQSKKKIEH